MLPEEHQKHAPSRAERKQSAGDAPGAREGLRSQVPDYIPWVLPEVPIMPTASFHVEEGNDRNTGSCISERVRISGSLSNRAYQRWRRLLSNADSPRSTATLGLEELTGCDVLPVQARARRFEAQGAGADCGYEEVIVYGLLIRRRDLIARRSFMAS